MKLTQDVAKRITNSNKRAATIRLRGSGLYHIAVADHGPRILCGIAMRGPLYADFHGGPARLCEACWKAFTKTTQPEPARLL